MTYFVKELLFLAVAAALFGQPSMADGALHGSSSTVAKKSKYSNRRLLVRYKDGTSTLKKDAAHFSVGAYVVNSFEVPSNLEVVEVAKGISLDAAQEFYREDPNVLYVEPDYPLHAYLEPPPANPNPPTEEDPPEDNTIDPRYTEQWGLNNDGQTGGTADVDINAPEMWQRITGDQNVIIAIIDTGVNYNHPDLVKNIWVNPGEIAGNNIDDDGNGVIDDIHGFNAIDNTGDPMDDHGHGSHCAGVIGAEALNTEGGRGVMQDVTIIGCKFLSATGGGTTAGAIGCLTYLRDLKRRTNNPVNIFASSNSWGGGPSSQALQDAIQEHQDLGILFVAAASNDGQDNDLVDTYPADYPLANIVSVAATDHKDDKAWFSNYGHRSVHVGAPGVDILSTVLGSDYEQMSGTSMATPFAAGLAGIIKAAYPDYDYIKVKNLLMAGGVPVSALAGKTVSGRRIRAIDENGLGSLSCEGQIVSGRLSPSVDRLLVPVGARVLLSAVNINCAEPNGDIIIPMNPGRMKFALLDNGKGIDSAANDGMYTKEWIAERPGRFEFTFPGDDKVVVSVYDPTNMKAYTNATEPLNYRQITGTALNALDDSVTTINTPFVLNFGGQGQGFDMVTIGSNGALSVTNTESIDMSNQDLPVDKYVSLIAPYWDDLNPAANDGDVFYDTLGQAPNREFVIEWRNVRHYSSQDSGTFQVVFFENSSDILFNYLDVDFGNAEYTNGKSATIGIQTTKDKVNQISHNTASIQSNSAIRFSLVSGSEVYGPMPE